MILASASGHRKSSQSVKSQRNTAKMGTARTIAFASSACCERISSRQEPLWTWLAMSPEECAVWCVFSYAFIFASCATGVQSVRNILQGGPVVRMQSDSRTRLMV